MAQEAETEAELGAREVTTATALAHLGDLYRATNFQECVVAARELLDPANPNRPTSPTEIDQARTYLAACLIRSGDPKAGEEEFERGIREAIEASRAFPRPNTLLHHASVVERFDAVMERIRREYDQRQHEDIRRAEDQRKRKLEREEREHARQRALMDLAATEIVVHSNRRWVAAIPFGVGQFQNRKHALGWVFLTTETVALGVAVGALAVELQLNSFGAEPESNLPRSRARTTWVAALYTFGGLAAGGILQAELAYVPEFREERRRDLPEELRSPTSSRRSSSRVRVRPLAQAVEGGGVLGLSGRF